MRKISPQVKAELESLPRMKICEARREYLAEGCSGRIEWHHVWTYAGRQIDEVWAIVGACEYHHSMVNKNPYIKRIFEKASLSLATAAGLSKYPRKPWEQIKKSLNIL